MRISTFALPVVLIVFEMVGFETSKRWARASLGDVMPVAK